MVAQTVSSVAEYAKQAKKMYFVPKFINTRSYPSQRLCTIENEWTYCFDLQYLFLMRISGGIWFFWLCAIECSKADFFFFFPVSEWSKCSKIKHPLRENVIRQSWNAMSNFLIMIQWLTKYLIFCAVHLDSSGHVCAKRYSVHCLVLALNMPQTRIQDVLVLNCQWENEGVGVSLFLVKSSLFAFCQLFSLISSVCVSVYRRMRNIQIWLCEYQYVRRLHFLGLCQKACQALPVEEWKGMSQWSRTF